MKNIIIPTYGQHQYFFFYDVITNLAMNAMIKDLNEQKMKDEIKQAASFSKKNTDSINIFQRFRKQLNLDFKDMDHGEI